jgi:hypothetical protein
MRQDTRLIAVRKQPPFAGLEKEHNMTTMMGANV